MDCLTYPRNNKYLVSVDLGDDLTVSRLEVMKLRKARLARVNHAFVSAVGDMKNITGDVDFIKLIDDACIYRLARSDYKAQYDIVYQVLVDVALKLSLIGKNATRKFNANPDDSNRVTIAKYAHSARRSSLERILWYSNLSVINQM